MVVFVLCSLLAKEASVKEETNWPRSYSKMQIIWVKEIFFFISLPNTKQTFDFRPQNLLRQSENQTLKIKVEQKTSMVSEEGVRPVRGNKTDIRGLLKRHEIKQHPG